MDVPEAEHANYYEGLPDPIEPNCAMASLNANQHCIAAVMTLSRFNAPCAMESRIVRDVLVAGGLGVNGSGPARLDAVRQEL